MKQINLLIAILLLSACTKDKTLEPQCIEEISFNSSVQPILMNSCAVSGCHDAASASNDMVFESYESVYQHRDMVSKAVKHESGVTPMPIGAVLSLTEIRAITCWIAQGAPNN